MKLRGTTRAIAMVVAMLLAGTALVGTMSFTHAEPAAAANGCGAGPTSDLVPELWFTSSCNTHDNCYEFKWYGDSEWGRNQCDSLFINDMLNACGYAYPAWWQSPARWGCQALAWVYWGVVRSLGWIFF